MVYWLFLYAFLIIMMCEGFPQLNQFGIRIVRPVALGVTVAFVITSSVVLGMRGMLTLPLFLTLMVLVLSSAFGVVEAYLGKIPQAPTSGRRIAASLPPQSTLNPRQTRTYIPVPVQMVAGKKGV